MKFTIKNNYIDDLWIGFVENIGDDFIYERIAKEGLISIDDKFRYVAFLTPHGNPFSITPNSRIFFEFMQAKPHDDNYANYDSYLFRITNFMYSESNRAGGGDADVDPPQSGLPLGKMEE